MQAAYRSHYGPPESLQIRDLPKPRPGPDELLVRVVATSVNRTDLGVLTGKPWVFRFFTGLGRPQQPITGTDFAGEVMEVGDQVQSFYPGQRVWGLHDEGLPSQAEYLCVGQKRAVIPIPDGVGYTAAVACAEGGHYAYNFLKRLRLPEEARVLVNGATGAIGSAALQMLKLRGARVTAVGDTAHLELLRQLGADKVYSYETEDFTAVDDEKYHYVLDAVGKSSFGRCKSLLLPGGAYLSSELGPRGENLYLPLITAFGASRKVIFPLPTRPRESLLHLNQLLAAGHYQPVIDRTYPLEKVREAYRYVATGRKTGSVILAIGF